MVDETNTSDESQSEAPAAEAAAVEPSTVEEGSNAGESQGTAVAGDAGDSAEQPAANAEQSATADGAAADASGTEGSDDVGTTTVTETPTDPTSSDHGQDPQEPETEAEPAASTDVTDVPQASQPEQLDGVEYPDHQVPAETPTTSTQETTNPEPETDADGNVVVPVTQVATPEPEAQAEAEPEIIPAQDRVTAAMLLVDVATGDYPVSLVTIFAKHPQSSFPQEPLRVDIEALGYAVVQNTDQPTGDVVTEGKPVEEDGVWKRTWDVRAFNDDEVAAYLTRKKSELNDKITLVREQDFTKGVPFTFNGEVFHAQVRPGDRINLFYLNTIAQARLAGNSTETEPFRSYENKSYLLPPQELLDLTTAALAGYKAILKASWDAKDQADNATAVADLPVVGDSFLPAATEAVAAAAEEPAAEEAAPADTGTSTEQPAGE